MQCACERADAPGPVAPAGNIAAGKHARSGSKQEKHADQIVPRQGVGHQPVELEFFPTPPRRRPFLTQE